MSLSFVLIWPLFAEFELYLQLKKHSPASSCNVAYLKAILADLAQCFVNTPVNSHRFLWQKIHFESAKQLRQNTDILLTKPDKGAGVVILNRADYIGKMNAILDDTDKFLKLGNLSFDDTQKLGNKLQKCFLKLFRRKFISKEAYEFICLVGLQRPRMYGLPKIHKPNVPLRPILSMCHSVQHSLAKWLVECLNPVLEFYSKFCVKDFTFSFIICRLPVCNDSQFLVSFDIVSLFTNISLDETIAICVHFLYCGPSTSVLPFPEDVFIELMEIATKSVSFTFNEIMYHQIDGISVGSPLGPICWVSWKIEKFPKPFIYLHYVNDTFVTLSLRNDALSFFHKLNDLHPSLSFTMEEEKSNKLPFLGMLVERCEFSFLTSVYRKLVFTGLYLIWDSFAPRSRKLNLIKCLSFRALNICCDSKIKEEGNQRNIHQ